MNKHFRKVGNGALVMRIFCIVLCLCMTTLHAAAQRADTPADYGQMLVSVKQDDGTFKDWTKTSDGMYLSPELSLGQLKKPTFIAWCVGHAYFSTEPIIPWEIDRLLISEDGTTFKEYTCAENGLNKIPQTAVRVKFKAASSPPIFLTIGESLDVIPFANYQATVSPSLVTGTVNGPTSFTTVPVDGHKGHQRLELTAKIAPVQYNGSSEQSLLKNAILKLELLCEGRFFMGEFGEDWDDVRGKLSVTFLRNGEEIQSSTTTYSFVSSGAMSMLATPLCVLVPKDATDVNIRIDCRNDDGTNEEITYFDEETEEEKLAYFQMSVVDPKIMIHEFHNTEGGKWDVINGMNLATVADHWYDIDGDGVKEWIIGTARRNGTTANPGSLTGNISLNKFRADLGSQIQLTSKGLANFDGWINYGNSDHIDAYSTKAIYKLEDTSFEQLVAVDDNYVTLRPLDYDNDGKPDFWKGKQYETSNTSGEILTLNHDGTFVSEQISLLTPQEYYNYIVQTGGSGLGSGMSVVGDPKPTPGANGSSFAQTDINNDGYLDFIDYLSGYYLLNTGDGRYVIDTFGGMVILRDFDGDGINDIFVYDSEAKEIKTILQRPEAEAIETKLFSGYSASKNIWIHDFDKDGDLDILVPFDAAANNGQAYLVMFVNNGNGTFKRRENFINGAVTFKGCVDYNADGNYEVIAVSNSGYDCSVSSYSVNGVNVIADAEIIAEFTDTEWYRSGFSMIAANIDNSGLMRLIFPHNMITPSKEKNTRPDRPNAPKVAYNLATGEVSVFWEPSSDKETAQLDLTYELRIGTAPDKGDILFAYATADGARMNMLQGNCGYSTHRRLNATGWPEGKIYVSVQAIDGGMMGSQFSDYTTFDKKQPAASFIISSMENATIGDEFELILTTPEQQGFTYEWNMADGKVKSHVNGRWVVTFPTAGDKELTLTVTSPAGNKSQIKRMVNVCRCRIERDENLADINAALDMDLDGKTELLCSRFYECDEQGVYTPVQRLFNSNLSLYSSGAQVVDLNNDGLPDVEQSGVFLYNEGDKYMRQEGEGTWRDYPNFLYDFDNDGYLDRFDTSIYRNSGDYQTFNEVFTFNATKYGSIKFPVDANGDGLVDFIASNGELYINNGGFNFQKDESFLLEKADKMSLCEDLDGNGKSDFAWNDASVWGSISNEADTTYVRWDDGSISRIPAPNGTQFKQIDGIFDVDNNGCYDLLINDLIVYLFADHTWKIEKIDNDNSTLRNIFYKRTDGRLGWNNYIMYGYPNEAPTAPTALRASQNNKAVVIEWNRGSDKETPAVGLRYNIAIKRKGAEGENAYFMSPLNGGVNGVSVPSGRKLLTSSKITIPIDVIPAGEYEVKVQSVDMQGLQSDFSETLEFKVATSGAFELPTATMVGKTTKIKLYAGINAADVNFGTDAEVISSTSQYVDVRWLSEGTKTVTCGDFTSSIYVHPALDASFVLPDVIYIGTKLIIHCDNAHNSKWELVHYQSGINSTVTVAPIPQNDAYNMRSIDENTVEFTYSGYSWINAYSIRHTVTEDYGSDVYEVRPNYMRLTKQPEISVVDIDAGGKYRISWDVPEELAPIVTDVKVFKETSKFGVFEQIATISSSATSYVDDNSNPIIKSERYAIAYGLVYGETKMCTPHQPMHLMINRGVGAGWNLCWNRYEGCDITSYRILRGTSASSLQYIAEVAGSNSSYTDLTAPSGECFYAVEFVVDGAAQAPASARVASTGRSSRSNVVSTADAGTLIPATSIVISSVNGDFDINGNESTSLQLSAMVYPVCATMRNVDWVVSSGNDIITIDAQGLVKALANGKATVRAIATDGSGIYDEVAINVENFVNTDGIATVKTDGYRSNDIYTIQGLLVKRNATDEDIRRLASGLYIIGGRKVVIR